MRVYISYELTDREIADKIIRLYTSLGFEVLTLSEKDRQSQNRAQIAETLIRRADVTVYIVSESALRSDRMTSESLLVGEQKRPIIPIIVGDIPDEKIPSEFSTYRVFRVATDDTLNDVAQETARLMTPISESISRPPVRTDDSSSPILSELTSLAEYIRGATQAGWLELAGARIQAGTLREKRGKTDRASDSVIDWSEVRRLQRSTPWLIGYVAAHILVIG